MPSKHLAAGSSPAGGATTPLLPIQGFAGQKGQPGAVQQRDNETAQRSVPAEGNWNGVSITIRAPFAQRNPNSRPFPEVAETRPWPTTATSPGARPRSARTARPGHRRRTLPATRGRLLRGQPDACGGSAPPGQAAVLSRHSSNRSLSRGHRRKDPGFTLTAGHHRVASPARPVPRPAFPAGRRSPGHRRPDPEHRSPVAGPAATRERTRKQGTGIGPFPDRGGAHARVICVSAGQDSSPA